MKTSTRILYLFLFLGFVNSATGQWRSPGVNPWVGADPEIRSGAPDFLISHTGNGQASMSFRINSTQWDAAMYRNASVPLALTTGLSPAGTAYRSDLVLDTLGYVGLGTKNPTARLTIRNGGLDLNDDVLPTMRFQVAGVNGALIRLGNEFLFRSLNRNIRMATDTGRIAFETVDTTRMVVLKNGNVGIGTTSPTSKLQVQGDICLTGIICNPSDVRLKKNILPVRNALKTVNLLNPVSYDFRSDEFPSLHFNDQKHMGLIAQEVESVLPALVGEKNMTYNEYGEEMSIKNINYMGLIPLLIKSVQELEDEVDILRTRLQQLEK